MKEQKAVVNDEKSGDVSLVSIKMRQGIRKKRNRGAVNTERPIEENR